MFVLEKEGMWWLKVRRCDRDDVGIGELGYMVPGLAMAVCNECTTKLIMGYKKN